MYQKRIHRALHPCYYRELGGLSVRRFSVPPSKSHADHQPRRRVRHPTATDKKEKKVKNEERVSDETHPASEAGRTGNGKPKRTRHTYSKAFEAFWNAYPPKRRRDKSDAAEEFKEAVGSLAEEHGSRKAAEQYLIQRATDYASSYAGQNCPKMPVTWLNKGCWADSDEAWADWKDGGSPQSLADSQTTYEDPQGVYRG